LEWGSCEITNVVFKDVKEKILYFE